MIKTMKAFAAKIPSDFMSNQTTPILSVCRNNIQRSSLFPVMLMLLLITTLCLRSPAYSVELQQSTPLVSRAEVPSPIVTSTADTRADDGVTTLREAIYYANAHPGTTISFNIPLAQAVGGVFTIKPDSLLPSITANGTVIDGSSQTAATGNTNAAGPEIELDGTNAGQFTDAGVYPDNYAIAGIGLLASNCRVNGLIINSFSGYGVYMYGPASGNRVEGCYIGTTATGMARRENAFSGVSFNSASGNTLGGTTAAARNIITSSAFSVTIAGASNNIVQGNYIGLAADGNTRLSTGGGIYLYSGSKNNIIGGAIAGAGNVIVNSDFDQTFGVQVQDAGTDNNVIQGNYIGTNKDGTTQLSNGTFGILVTAFAQNNTIGGTSPAARNVIGVQFEGAVALTSVTNNIVQGNYLGVNATGTAPLGAGRFAMLIYAGAGNTIGGTGNGAGNIIGGNNNMGIWLLAEPGVPATANNKVQGNFIGVKPDGSAAPGRQAVGVRLSGNCPGNIIGLAPNGTGKGNVIAFNTAANATMAQAGVLLSHESELLPSGNSIRGNSIYSNSGLGINIQPSSEAINAVTPNDAQDIDSGANGLQNFPVLTYASSGSLTTIGGTLNSTPNTSFLIDFYSNSAPDSSGYGEGQTYLGVKGVVTDASGNATFSFTAPGNMTGRFVSATATNANTGDTSEFSLCRQVLSSSTTFSISGRIANHSGVGIANVQVTRSGGGNAFTNANGDYVLTSVPIGTYTIAPVITPGLNGVTLYPASRSVTVGSSNLSNQNFTASFSVSGRVANHSGVGIPNIQVKRTAGASVVSVFTDSSGNYRFTDVRSGSYTLAPVLTPSMSGLSFTPTALNITVDRNNITNQNFIGMFSINGRATTSAGVALPNVLVRLNTATSSTSVLTDSNGNYQFRNVRSGSYSLTASQSGKTFTPASRSVTVETLSLTNENFIGAN